jgi:hypothetical protein
MALVLGVFLVCLMALAIAVAAGVPFWMAYLGFWVVFAGVITSDHDVFFRGSV